MNIRTRPILLAFLLCSSIGAIRASDVNINAERLIVSIDEIKDAGLDWILLQYKQPFDPEHPEPLPLDTVRSLRGALSPAQSAVLSRAIDAHKWNRKEIVSKTIPADTKVDLPTENDGAQGTVSISGSPVSSTEIQIKAFGTDPAVVQEGTIVPGGTVVLSVPCEDENFAWIYLITMKES